MARRKEIKKRVALPDPKFGSTLLTKFINTVMVDGKKSISEAIVYGALEILSQKVPEQEPITTFTTAIENAKPVIQVKSRRVGGATYQVPIEIAPNTRTAITFRWVIEFSRKRSEKTMKERLAAELLDCYSNQGTTVKRKDDTHRMAEANKAFAHFRF